jgi:CheY-like chemotaxis protein
VLTDGSHILVVDDSNVNREIVARLLGRLGRAADTATDGLGAIAACESVDYDVVLMDVQMPKVNGLEATRQIRRALPTDRQPWMIAMTGSLSEDNRYRCRLAGMDDFLAKPVRLESLREALERAEQTDAHAANGDGQGRHGARHSHVFDPSVLAELSDRGEALEAGFGARLIGLYRAQAQELIDTMEMAAAAGDLETVRGVAHTLKGTSATLGALLLPALCDGLVRFKPGQPGIDQVVKEIRQANEQLLAAVEHGFR